MKTWISTPLSPSAPASLGQFVEAEHKKRIRRNTTGAKAVVKFRTIETLGHLPRLAQTEIVRRAAQAQETGWHKQHPLGYEDVASMLKAALQGTSSLSTVCDTTYLAVKVLPFLKEHGLRPDILLGEAGTASAKARAIVPRLRVHEKSSNGKQEVADKWLKEIEQLTDPAVSKDDIRAQNQGSKQVPAIHIYETPAADGKVTLTLTVSPRQATYVQKRLNGKAKWHKCKKNLLRNK